MATRKEYAQCVGQGLKGKQFTKEERKLEFCTLSKLCSGKAKTREEAERICRLPKAPKPVKSKGVKQSQSCEKSAYQVAECVVSYLNENTIYRDQALNINSVGSAITNALIECQCPRQ